MKKFIGCSIVLCILMMMFVSCGGKNAAYVGTWTFVYDGSNGGKAFANRDGSIAIGELSLKKNGTFHQRRVANSKNYEGIWLSDDIFAHYVNSYAEEDGTWNIEDEKLIMIYDNTGNRFSYDNFELDKKQKTLRIGNTVYHKK